MTLSRPIGFSTGALAAGDFRRALRLLDGHSHLDVVELSALRDTELAPLLAAVDSLELKRFTHVALHAPSRYQTLTEQEVLAHLRTLLPRRWPLVVHPDALTDWPAWAALGAALCVENMDKRKPTGRTVSELAAAFERLPQAGFCLDLGHARQVDPTMGQAALMLKAFGSRLRQLHVSEVNSRSGHEPLTYAALQAFRKVAALVPPHVPLVLETPVPAEGIQTQVVLAAEAFAPPLAPAV